MMVWLLILGVSVFMLGIGWHNLPYYDELVPRGTHYDNNLYLVVEFPVLTAEEKLIRRYKIYFYVIGAAGTLCSLCHLLPPQ